MAKPTRLSSIVAPLVLFMSGMAGAATARPPPPVYESPWLPAVYQLFWDETAVRKVLHAFAYGGMAGDAQISAWASMTPQQAVQQMLTTETHNLLLAPMVATDTDGVDQRNGRLGALVDYWTSGDVTVPVLDKDYHYYPERAWITAATLRGLNPVRQKLGLWETNYHLVANQQAGVTPEQIYHYYDAMLDALAASEPYQDVISIAASSAAIALQYKHHENIYSDGICYCNEDFAREYHQLFFGILGGADARYHELVTVKNTASVLTDMRLEWSAASGWPVEVEFGTEYHAPGALEVLQHSVAGVTAQEKIDALSQYAIEHPDSWRNLPVKIIAGLADDNLTSDKFAAQYLRNAWRDMRPKTLLPFLRAYAISYQFHSPGRVKYLTSIDRQLLITNQLTLTNEETYLELYTPWDLATEGVQAFSPRHNVFGGQTGIEAAASADVFRVNYNRATAGYSRNAKTHDTVSGWEKNWAAAAPVDSSGNYRVDHLAEWLWKRFIGDGLKNFGLLERAHVYAWLAHGVDLVHIANRVVLENAGQDPGNADLYDYQLVVTTAALQNDPLLIDEQASMAVSTVALDSADLFIRRDANYRVGQAINFIVATPFVFAQEGR